MISRREFALGSATLALVGCGAQPGRSQASTRSTALRMLTPRATHASAVAGGGVLMIGGFAREGGGLAMVERFDTAAGKFERFATLEAARIQPVAVPLDNGSVLVMGGWGAGEDRSSAELIAADGSVTALGAMNDRRTASAAQRLRDGRVLVTGGSRPGYVMLASAETYDPATRRFTTIAPMRVARAGHSATLLPDGRVLIAGGGEGDNIRAEAEIFDPATSSFTMAPPMHHARYKHGAVTLADGSPLVIGGSDERSGPDGRGRLMACERFDPTTGSFVAAPSLSPARYKLNEASVAMPGGEIVVASGADVAEVWRPETGRFEAIGDFGVRRDFMTAARLDARRLLVAGGYDATVTATDSAWLLEI